MTMAPLRITKPEPMTAAALRAWREHWLLDQGDLAQALGVSLATVNRWERGVGPIPSYLQLALETLANDFSVQYMERARGPAAATPA